MRILIHLNDCPLGILRKENLIAVGRSHGPGGHVNDAARNIETAVYVFVDDALAFEDPHCEVEIRMAVAPTLFSECVAWIATVQLVGRLQETLGKLEVDVV